MSIVCFHNPDEENGYLSNWYLSEFECDGIRFSSMEQYMMYQKAICFGDTKIAEKILKLQMLHKLRLLEERFQIIMKQSGKESDRFLFTMDFVQNFKIPN